MLDSSRPKILIVEDNPAIRQAIKLFLEDQCFAVCAAASAEEALKEFSDQQPVNPYGVVLLDIMLPGLDGLSFCRQLRRINQNLGIIIISARVSDIDQQLGLRSGADDYITKPFALETLCLKIYALARRLSHTLPADCIALGSCKISLSEATAVSSDNRKIKLTARETKLLRYLAANSDRVVSRQELLAHVWGFKHANLLVTRTIDIHIAKLRKKIEPDPQTPRFLLTRHALGYQLILDSQVKN